MKNTYKQLSAAVIVSLFLFSSCSRELTSVPQVNHLANAQTLEKQKSPIQKPEPLALTQTTSPQLLPSATNPIALPSSSGKTIQLAPAKKSIFNPIASISPKKAAKQILKQAEALRHLGSNNQISSYSKTNHTEGWIGLAVTCLIVAIILFALGFGLAAAIVWEIGIIILVVAIIFFILWLMARAVAG